MTVTIHVDENDLRSLEHKLSTIPRPALERIIDRAAPYTRDQAQAGAPRLTGALVRSIVSDGHGMEARVHSALAYAMPQEFGRHAGGTKISGRPRRGSAGRFFLRRAIQMLISSELPRLFRKAVDEIESAWGRG